MGDGASLQEAIYKTLIEFSDLSEESAQEAAFHLTDWYDDLNRLHGAYENCDGPGRELYEAILKFLIHAPEHIVRATKLVIDTDIENIFD